MKPPVDPVDLSHPRTTAGAYRRIGGAIDALRARAKIASAAETMRVGDKQRVAFDIRRRAELYRDGRSRNNKLFAHGSGAEVGGYIDLDDIAITGLDHHLVQYALWLATAAYKLPPGSTRGDALALILSNPARLEWARREGARVRWHWAEAAYAEEVADFRARQASAPARLKAWRRLNVTERQCYLVELIRVYRDLPTPDLSDRGAAYDWIDAQGGAPRFWSPPPPAPEWV